MDYAIPNWPQHLKAAIPALKDLERNLRLQELLESFVELHYVSSNSALAASSTDRDVLQHFKGHSFFEQLLKAYASATKQLKYFGDKSDDHNALDLIKIALHVRNLLEKVVSSAQNKEEQLIKFEVYYGKNVFKCPRMSCRFFNEGFSDQEERAQHLRKHELPFTCTYEGCLRADLGFSSEKALRAHAIQQHEASKQSKARYPSKRDLDSQHNPAIFHCKLCPQQFNQYYNLRAHMRKHQAEEKRKSRDSVSLASKVTVPGSPATPQQNSDATYLGLPAQQLLAPFGAPQGISPARPDPKGPVLDVSICPHHTLKPYSCTSLELYGSYS